jgi:hypothetical protein
MVESAPKDHKIHQTATTFTEQLPNIPNGGEIYQIVPFQGLSNNHKLGFFV